MASIKICVVLALLAAVSAESQTRVVGGSHTTIEEYPYVVAVVYHYPGPSITVQRCVGSLISSWHVLCSGFCFTGAVLENMVLRAGSTNSLSGGQLVQIANFVKLPGYLETPRVEDMSLITMQTPLGISSTVNVLYLPAQNTYIPDGTAGRVVSWGFEYEGGAQLETLKTVELYKMGFDDCMQAYSDTDLAAITDSVICAMAEGKGMCNGDSGAPLTLSQVLVGIYSFNLDCSLNHPDLFLRVDRHTNWILENARSVGPRTATHIPGPMVVQL